MVWYINSSRFLCIYLSSFNNIGQHWGDFCIDWEIFYIALKFVLYKIVYVKHVFRNGIDSSNERYLYSACGCVFVCTFNSVCCYQKQLEAPSILFYSSITEGVLTWVSKNRKDIIHIELHDLITVFYPKVTSAFPWMLGKERRNETGIY